MFITFEGIDCSGKTTQIQRAAKFLKDKGHQVVTTKEPGGTKIGLLIRSILLSPQNSEMTPKAELLLYLADRIQHLHEVIRPALEEGKIVLCDRYHDATKAYQGVGRGLDLDWMKPLEESEILTPDLTLWFDLPLSESQKRLAFRTGATGEEACRIEKEEAAFFNRVSMGYQVLMEHEPQRIQRIQADQAPDQVEKQVLQVIKTILPKM